MLLVKSAKLRQVGAGGHAARLAGSGAEVERLGGAQQ